MTVVFFDKKDKNYVTISGVSHLHPDYLYHENVWVMYTDMGMRLLNYENNTLHKIDG